jgi:hypothetical protein
MGALADAAAAPPPPPTAGFESVDASVEENLNEQTPATAAAPCQITLLQFQLWKRQKVCTSVWERECVSFSLSNKPLSLVFLRETQSKDRHLL